MSFFVENKMIVNSGATPVTSLDLNQHVAGNFLARQPGAPATGSDQNFATQLFKGRRVHAVPTLPQSVSPEALAQRRFDLSLKRTAYNYTNTYFDGVSVSANIPLGEEYDGIFKAKIFEVALTITENFKNVVLRILRENLANNMPDSTAVDRLKASFDKLRQGDFSIFNMKKEMANIDAFVASLNEVIDSVSALEKLPGDIEKILFGVKKLSNEFAQHGAPALLKSSMHDLLSMQHGRDYRHATCIEDYERMFDTIK